MYRVSVYRRIMRQSMTENKIYKTFSSLQSLTLYVCLKF